MTKDLEPESSRKVERKGGLHIHEDSNNCDEETED